MPAQSYASDAARPWLAAVLRGGQPVWDPSLGSDADLLSLAQGEGVVGLLDVVLARHADLGWLPPRWRQQVAAAAREQMATELLRGQELRRVLAALDVGAIPALLLKGSALAYGLYPQPWCRPRCDMDVLVADAAMIERCKPALAALGYRPSNVPTTTAIAYEITLKRASERGYVHWIDAHWALNNNTLYAGRFGFQELMDASQAVPSLGPAARALAPVHALLHACMHRVANLVFGDADRLIWLYDLHLLSQRLDADDWLRLLEDCRQRQLAGPCLEGLRATCDHLATPVPDGVMAQLQALAAHEAFDVRKADRRWYVEWHNLRAVPGGQRLRWLREKLFPDQAFMREVHGVAPSSGLSAGYLKRLGRAIASVLRHRPL